MTYNIYCFNCKKIQRAESTKEDPSSLKCPICGKPSKVVGKKITVITSNGPFEPHY